MPFQRTTTYAEDGPLACGLYQAPGGPRGRLTHGCASARASTSDGGASRPKTGSPRLTFSPCDMKTLLRSVHGAVGSVLNLYGIFHLRVTYVPIEEPGAGTAGSGQSVLSMDALPILHSSAIQISNNSYGPKSTVWTTFWAIIT